MDLDRALEHAFDGDAILFVGAGFSGGAKNLRGEPFKTGRQLATHLSHAVELSEDTPLDDASEEFARKHGVDRLIVELQQEYTASEIADHHLSIARIPWRRIYTTNYDNVLETACSRLLRRLNPIVLADRIRAISKEDTLCVHLNGYVDRLNRDTLLSEFKLTDTSYVSASVLDSPWMVMFRQDLRLARALFFLGYSLADLDIKRALFKTPELREKTFFVLGGRADTVTARRASRFGTVLSSDTAAFAATATQKATSYSPPERVERIGDSIRKFSSPRELSSFSDRLVFDLLLLGDLKPEFVWSGLHGGARYFLERSGVAQALDQLDASGPLVVVHSDLGNGKTLLIEGIKCRAVERGYDVYVVTRRADELFGELDTVLRSRNKVLLIIDDYPAWLDVLEHVGVHGKPDTRLLLSARSSVHDVMIDRACTLLERPDVVELSLDRLAAEDLTWIADFFDEYGLWGDKASWSRYRKLSYLERDCEAQFHAILLSVLKSPQILSRLSRVLEELTQKRGYYDVVLSILVLAVLQYPTSVDTLVDIWGERVLEAQFRQNPAVRELLDVRQGQVLLRSSVAARYILQRAADAAVIVDILARMARIADRAAGASPLYREMTRDLMRFGNLQILLPEEQRRPSVLRYYESIKSLSSCRQNPHFWLQYAIASMVIEDFERAERYFTTAYSLAKDREHYDTRMIDNHFSRFLIVGAIRADDAVACMSAFRKARKIIYDQIQKERLHYPYRVAMAFAEFYDVFESRLSPEDRGEIARAARYIADRIARLPEYRREQRYVSECADAMEYVLERARTSLEG